MIYIPYVMQNKYKKMHSLQFFVWQIPEDHKNPTLRREIKVPELLSQFGKFLGKQHQPSTRGTSHFSAINPLFNALKGSNKSCNPSTDLIYLMTMVFNWTKVVKNKNYNIHTPAWKTCPHSKFLTSSQLKASWQMMQISSSSLGGCLDKTKSIKYHKFWFVYL